MTHHLLVVSRLRLGAAVLLALTGACTTRVAGRATPPNFLTGFCVPPDTSDNGVVNRALSAMVGDPEHVPILLPSKLPPYPKKLRRDGYSGTVRIAFVVDTLGRPVVETAKVLDSTDPILSHWACGAVAKLRYTPAKNQGRRVFAQAAQPFTYNAFVIR